MQYPQAYVLIDKQFELPSIETLQIWCKSKSPVYIQGVSEKNESMEARINNILEIHGHLDSNSHYSNQVVVFTGKKVGYFMNVAFGNYLRKTIGSTPLSTQNQFRVSERQLIQQYLFIYVWMKLMTLTFV